MRCRIGAPGVIACAPNHGPAYPAKFAEAQRTETAGRYAEAAAKYDAAAKEATLALLSTNSAAAAASIRALSDEQLDRAAPVSLNSDAPLTCQFTLEDHAVRHSYHHVAGIKAALGR